MVQFATAPANAAQENQQQFTGANLKTSQKKEWRPSLRPYKSHHHKRYQKDSWQKQHAASTWQQPRVQEMWSEGCVGTSMEVPGSSAEIACAMENVMEPQNDGMSGGVEAGKELLALLRGTEATKAMPDKEEDLAPSFHFLNPTAAASQLHEQNGDMPVWSCTNAAADISNSYDFAEAEAAELPELWALLAGDETLQGPDGDLYDVFYPDAVSEIVSASENFSVVSMSPSEKPLQCKDSEKWSTSPSARKLTRASSAEDCLQDLLHEMHHAVLERHPAKKQLFSAVHTAAETALGNAFARLALVGSTAMQIDTPASDLDVVVFTRPTDDGLQGVDALRWIAAALRGIEPSISVELIDCAKVPILIATTADGNLSIDVSVDQPLAESHVLWFQMQHEELPCQGPLHRVPTPAATTEWGLAAALCRVLKWWLSRRGIPGAKEGGFPALVWLLMAMHSLRCSLFVDQADAAAGRPHGLRQLLGALAAFFDRFSRPSGFWGAIVFAQGMHSEFWLHRKAVEGASPREDGAHAEGKKASAKGSLPISADFAVFDPARAEPADLAVRMSPATWLLFAFELQRAAQLTASALSSMSSQYKKSKVGGRAALRELFSKVGTTKINVLPTVLPTEASAGIESYRPLAGIFLTSSDAETKPRLQMGVISVIKPNPGWSAPFLHRRDVYSQVHVNFCDLYGETLCVPREQIQILRPYDFVCGLQLRWLDRTRKVFEIADADVERFVGMDLLLSEECA